MAQALMVLPSQTPDIEIKSFELLETESNWRSFELRGPHAEVFKKAQLVGLSQPFATLWNRSGSQTQIRGESGIINSQSGDVQISGSTQIEAQNGMVFSTESITYLSVEKKISSENHVKGRSKVVGNQSPGLEISGTGLNVDVKSQAYSIRSDVKARQNNGNGKNSDFFDIQSHSASIYPVTNKAQFSGNARVKSKKMNLRGETALLILSGSSAEASIEGIEMSSPSRQSSVLADVENFVINSRGFKATFAPGGALLESKAMGSVTAVSPSGVKMSAQTLKLKPGTDGFVVNLEEGVKITIDDRIATCEEAVYYPSTGNIVLKKFASVIREDQELNGDLIRLSTQNSEVIVEKASGTLSREAIQKKKKQ